ncbi:hypothetical protein EIP86_011526 [Pleurotus ostreatoroseus]|nr:hypothetical protein EIP86_011526 [Pleurotus ostreatoroseus]
MRPLITICGTTGVGKSKLGIELALALSDSTRKHGGFQGARIINADAMQVYAGLDVLTNKVPVDEQCGVEHLLMGFKQPGEQYVVGQWVKEASHLIDETHRRNQIPIVVGGTSYWIQHLILPERLLSTFDNEKSDSDEEHDRPPVEKSPTHERSQALLSSLSSLPPDLLDLFNHLPETCPSASSDPESAFALHRLLQALDPMVAQRWHWKDTRKVLRSLVIIQQTGKLPSEIIDEQSQHTPQPREFSTYFDKRNAAEAVDEENLLREAVDRMKLSTRKYAKRQVSWIRNKLLPAAYAANRAQTDGEEVISAYLLDATELGVKWNTNVRSQANAVTEDFLENRSLPDPLSLSETARVMLTIKDKATDPNAVLSARQRVICPTCTTREDQPVMIEEGAEWGAHVRTRRHRRLAGQVAKRAEGARRADLARVKEATSDCEEDALGDNVDAARDLFGP